jgi:hypothetical protein
MLADNIPCNARNPSPGFFLIGIIKKRHIFECQPQFLTMRIPIAICIWKTLKSIIEAMKLPPKIWFVYWLAVCHQQLPGIS